MSTVVSTGTPGSGSNSSSNITARLEPWRSELEQARATAAADGFVSGSEQASLDYVQQLLTQAEGEFTAGNTTAADSTLGTARQALDVAASLPRRAAIEDGLNNLYNQSNDLRRQSMANGADLVALDQQMEALVAQADAALAAGDLAGAEALSASGYALLGQMQATLLAGGPPPPEGQIRLSFEQIMADYNELIDPNNRDYGKAIYLSAPSPSVALLLSLIESTIPGIDLKNYSNAWTGPRGFSLEKFVNWLRQGVESFKSGSPGFLYEGELEIATLSIDPSSPLGKLVDVLSKELGYSEDAQFIRGQGSLKPLKTDLDTMLRQVLEALGGPGILQGNRYTIHDGGTGQIVGTMFDDTVTIRGTARDGLNLQLGSGNDSVVGGDIVVLGGAVDLGAGNDTVTLAGSFSDLTVLGNAGRDIIQVVGSAINLNIDAGNNEDEVTVYGYLQNARVSGGAGNDKITVAGVVVGGTIAGDQGNDTVMIDGRFEGTVVNMSENGKGNDTLIAGENLSGNLTVTDNARSRVNWRGKNLRHEDTLFLGGSGWTLVGGYNQAGSAAVRYGADGQEIARISLGTGQNDGYIERIFSDAADGQDPEVLRLEKPKVDKKPFGAILGDVLMAVGKAALSALVPGAGVAFAVVDMVKSIASGNWLGALIGGLGVAGGIGSLALKGVGVAGSPTQFMSTSTQATIGTAVRVINDVKGGLQVVQGLQNGFDFSDVLGIASYGLSLAPSSPGVDTASSIVNYAQIGYGLTQGDVSGLGGFLGGQLASGIQSLSSQSTNTQQQVQTTGDQAAGDQTTDGFGFTQSTALDSLFAGTGTTTGNASTTYSFTTLPNFGNGVVDTNTSQVDFSFTSLPDFNSTQAGSAFSDAAFSRSTIGNGTSFSFTSLPEMRGLFGSAGTNAQDFVDAFGFGNSAGTGSSIVSDVGRINPLTGELLDPSLGLAAADYAISGDIRLAQAADGGGSSVRTPTVVKMEDGTVHFYDPVTHQYLGSQDAQGNPIQRPSNLPETIGENGIWLYWPDGTIQLVPDSGNVPVRGGFVRSTDGVTLEDYFTGQELYLPGNYSDAEIASLMIEFFNTGAVGGRSAPTEEPDYEIEVVATQTPGANQPSPNQYQRLLDGLADAEMTRQDEAAGNWLQQALRATTAEPGSPGSNWISDRWNDLVGALAGPRDNAADSNAALLQRVQGNIDQMQTVWSQIQSGDQSAETLARYEQLRNETSELINITNNAINDQSAWRQQYNADAAQNAANTAGAVQNAVPSGVNIITTTLTGSPQLGAAAGTFTSLGFSGVQQLAGQAFGVSNDEINASGGSVGAQALWSSGGQAITGFIPQFRLSPGAANSLRTNASNAGTIVRNLTPAALADNLISNVNRVPANVWQAAGNTLNTAANITIDSLVGTGITSGYNTVANVATGRVQIDPNDPTGSLINAFTQDARNNFLTDLGLGVAFQAANFGDIRLGANNANLSNNSPLTGTRSSADNAGNNQPSASSRSGIGPDGQPFIDVDSVRLDATSPLGQSSSGGWTSDTAGQLAPRTSVYQSSPTLNADGTLNPGRVEIRPLNDGVFGTSDTSFQINSSNTPLTGEGTYSGTFFADGQQASGNFEVYRNNYPELDGRQWTQMTALLDQNGITPDTPLYRGLSPEFIGVTNGQIQTAGGPNPDGTVINTFDPPASAWSGDYLTRMPLFARQVQGNGYVDAADFGTSPGQTGMFVAPQQGTAQRYADRAPSGLVVEMTTGDLLTAGYQFAADAALFTDNALYVTSPADNAVPVRIVGDLSAFDAATYVPFTSGAGSNQAEFTATTLNPFGRGASDSLGMNLGDVTNQYPSSTSLNPTSSGSNSPVTAGTGGESLVVQPSGELTFGEPSVTISNITFSHPDAPAYTAPTPSGLFNEIRNWVDLRFGVGAQITGTPGGPAARASVLVGLDTVPSLVNSRDVILQGLLEGNVGQVVNEFARAAGVSGRYGEGLIDPQFARNTVFQGGGTASAFQFKGSSLSNFALASALGQDSPFIFQPDPSQNRIVSEFSPSDNPLDTNPPSRRAVMTGTLRLNASEVDLQPGQTDIFGNTDGRFYVLNSDLKIDKGLFEAYTPGIDLGFIETPKLEYRAETTGEIRIPAGSILPSAMVDIFNRRLETPQFSVSFDLPPNTGNLTLRDIDGVFNRSDLVPGSGVPTSIISSEFADLTIDPATASGSLAAYGGTARISSIPGRPLDASSQNVDITFYPGESLINRGIEGINWVGTQLFGQPVFDTPPPRSIPNARNPVEAFIPNDVNAWASKVRWKFSVIPVFKLPGIGKIDTSAYIVREAQKDMVTSLMREGETTTLTFEDDRGEAVIDVPGWFALMMGREAGIFEPTVVGRDLNVLPPGGVQSLRQFLNPYIAGGTPEQQQLVRDFYNRYFYNGPVTLQDGSSFTLTDNKRLPTEVRDEILKLFHDLSLNGAP